MWLTLKSLAKNWNLSESGLQKKIKRGEITEFKYVNGNGTGRGGKVLEINIQDRAIPAEIKSKILHSLYNEEFNSSNPAADRHKTPIAIPELSATMGSSESYIASLSYNQGREMTSSVLCFFSEKAKTIALARMDLLRAWEDYRSKHPQKTHADNEFITAYNSDLSYTNLRDILGVTSVKTLYRWKADLGASNDWTRLVPGFLEKVSKGP